MFYGYKLFITITLRPNDNTLKKPPGKSPEIPRSLYVLIIWQQTRLTDTPLTAHFLISCKMANQEGIGWSGIFTLRDAILTMDYQNPQIGSQRIQNRKPLPLAHPPHYKSLFYNWDLSLAH